MAKKILIAAVVFIIFALCAIFIYRYQILQYSAESFIKKVLPNYVKIDKIEFVGQEHKVIIKGFEILNPPGFSSDCLLKIDEINAGYKLKGKSIMDGLEITEPSLKKPVLYIERMRNGVLNLSEMQKVLEKNGPARTGEGQGSKITSHSSLALPGNRKISDIIKLPEIFALKDGQVIFTDNLNFSRPYVITFDDVNSTISLKLNEFYSAVLNVSSNGGGRLNHDRSEAIKWSVTLNPATPRLTMSSRFDVTGLSILTFEPYYDKYSPLIFKSGRFSGTLIFDFDNGNIGSSDEIHLLNFRFDVKPGSENAVFWDTTVPDLVRYFTTSQGEIIFDFKIKGDMSSPRFYLGPISKQALTSMAIDKISNAIEQANSPGGSKSDIGKAKEYIDLFKGMINKK